MVGEGLRMGACSFMLHRRGELGSRSCAEGGLCSNTCLLEGGMPQRSGEMDSTILSDPMLWEGNRKYQVLRRPK